MLDVSTIGTVCMCLLILSFVIFAGLLLYKVHAESDNTYTQLSAYENEGYAFTVDGVVLHSLDEDTKTNAVMRYSIVCDEKSKQVVMTSIRRLRL